MNKHCFKCGQWKKIELFYKHPRMADGYLNKCKQCTKRDVKRRYESPAGRRKVRAYDKARTQTAHRKAKRKLYAAKFREQRPGAYRAKMIIGNAIRGGVLIRKPCEVCGNLKSEAHHDDYRKPLNVRWLCFTHHREAHGQIVGDL